MPHSGGEARPKRRPLWQLALKAVVDGGPGTCHFAVTSICNARCEFCNFAVDRMPAGSRHSVTLDDANRATEILSRNGVQFLIFTGGEPLAHRDFIAMVRHASGLGMTTTLVTNGSLLTPDRIGALADAGLASVYISIDAASAQAHERNRGLPGVCNRIRDANAHFKRLGITTAASVTMSRLVDYAGLPPFLTSLGFKSLTFSYPLSDLASPYLSYSDSKLVAYTKDELHEAFEAVKVLKKSFPGTQSDRVDRGYAAPSARRAGAIRVHRRVEVFLPGLASRSLPLPQLGAAALPRLRIRWLAACPRRLHGVHDRLLSRQQRNAAYRCRRQ